MQPIYCAMASNKMRLYAYPSAAILSLLNKEETHLGSRQWTAPPNMSPAAAANVGETPLTGTVAVQKNPDHVPHRVGRGGAATLQTTNT